jgi:signal transduction histidine kinase
MNTAKRLNLLVEMLRNLSRSRDSVGSVNTFLRAMRRLNGDYGLVSISRRNVPPGSYRVMRFMHQEGVAQDGLSDVLYAGADAKVLGGGFIGEIIEADAPRLFEDVSVSADPAVGDSLAPYRTILAAPVFDGGESLNWVLYVRAAPRAFRPQEVEELILQANLMGGLTTAKQHARDAAEKREQLERALRDLRQMQDQVIAQEKLASLGALTAGIAHEIRNPLNFVTNFAALSEDLIQDIEDRLGGGAGRADLEPLFRDLRENVARIREHGDRANSIVKGMLGHATHRRGESAATDINALLEEYRKLAYFGLGNGDARPDVEFVTDYAADLGEIHVVPQDLGRAVLNVVANACQAVEARRATAESGYRPTIRLQTRRADGHVEIRIRDNGTGMSRDVAGHAFDPFFTTKSAGSGTGLGLSIVHTIVVQEHHGSIELLSAPGEFTECVIKLPATLGAFGNVHDV